MKKLLCIAGFWAMATTLLHAQNGASQSWSFTITPATTRTTVDSVIADWKTHGIDLRIYSPRYNSNGVLLAFSGSVAYFPGKSHVGAKFNNASHKTITIQVTDKPSVTVNEK
ncbi:MAG: hypothetical protein HKL88_03475 [Bacteroidia bacterium]|jgi:hypothetical protein|nr:hypothetical protein [Bacteroidia bacterium]